MRPTVFVYAALLDHEKLASYMEAMSAFEPDSLNEATDAFFRAAASDSGLALEEIERQYRIVVDTSNERKRLVLGWRPNGWRSIRVKDMTLFFPGPESALWQEFSEEDYSDCVDSLPNAYEILLDRPMLMNEGLAPDCDDFLMSMSIDRVNGIVNIISQVELEGFHRPYQLIPQSHLTN